MPPQGLNLNENRTEGGVTAPRAQSAVFLGHKVSKYICFFFYFPFNGCLARLSFGLFFLGGGGRMIVSEHLGGRAPPQIHLCQHRDYRAGLHSIHSVHAARVLEAYKEKNRVNGIPRTRE